MLKLQSRLLSKKSVLLSNLFVTKSFTTTGIFDKREKGEEDAYFRREDKHKIEELRTSKIRELREERLKELKVILGDKQVLPDSTLSSLVNWKLRDEHIPDSRGSDV